MQSRDQVAVEPAVVAGQAGASFQHNIIDVVAGALTEQQRRLADRRRTRGIGRHERPGVLFDHPLQLGHQHIAERRENHPDGDDQQGPDQLRQYTASYVYLTEMAFWEWAEETYAALLPTIQGGGKIVMDSSAGPGFFERLIHGEA